MILDATFDFRRKIPFASIKRIKHNHDRFSLWSRMLCLLGSLSATREEKREREGVSLVVTITTLFDYGNYESCVAREGEKRRRFFGGGMRMMMMMMMMMTTTMMMLGGEKKKKEQRAVGSCVLLDGSMKRRDRDATLYPGGWRGKKGGKNTGGIVAAKLRMGRECTLR